MRAAAAEATTNDKDDGECHRVVVVVVATLSPLTRRILYIVGLYICAGGWRLLCVLPLTLSAGCCAACPQPHISITVH